MSQPQINNNMNNIKGTPLYNYSALPQTLHTEQGQTVSINPQNSSYIYNYPTSSLYEPQKQTASGVNIVICNPAGYSSGNSGAVPYYPVLPQVINNIPQQPAPVVNNTIDAQGQVPVSNPVANTPIANSEITDKAGNKTQKPKRITKITDDYIKNLENYLRDPSKEVRQIGITQLVKLFEEDDPTRYEDPALTALLNIALQDADAANRIAAMLPIATGSAHGDENTKLLLEKLASSTKMYGEEANLAKEALLQVTKEVNDPPENSQ